MEDDLFFQNFLATSRRRKRKGLFYEDEEESQAGYESENNILETVPLLSAVMVNKERKERGPVRDRSLGKLQWDNLYRNDSEEKFIDKMRINRETFDIILNTLWDELILSQRILFQIQHRLIGNWLYPSTDWHMGSHTMYWKMFLAYRRNLVVSFLTKW